MIEPCHRTIVDGKGKSSLRLVAEREPDRRLDCSAVRNGYHVLAGVLRIDALDRAAHTIIEIHKTLAAWRRIIDRRKPVAADRDRPAGEECRTVQTLPLAEMLFGECSVLLQACGLGKSRRPDRICGLMRPLQMARVPHGLARQNFAHRPKHHAIATIAAEVLLPVNAAAVLPYRRVTHPPPSRCHDPAGNGMLQNEWLVWIGHRKHPS